MITVSIVLENGLTIPINLDSGASVLDLAELGAKKVDKVTGKGLSTNDYDNTEKAKVDASIDNSTDTYTSEAKIEHAISLTQVEYDAIETPDENTLYYIPVV